MTWQSGGGGGIPGVTSDGLTPGGERVAGAIVAGDSTAVTVPTYHVFYGMTTFQDVVGTNVDQDLILRIHQSATLTADSPTNAIDLHRGGTNNAFTYTQPAIDISDSSASLAPLISVEKGILTLFVVDVDGNQINGKIKTDSSVTHTLGAYSGKSVPIYDESGTLLGYMPLYA